MEGSEDGSSLTKPSPQGEQKESESKSYAQQMYDNYLALLKSRRELEKTRKKAKPDTRIIAGSKDPPRDRQFQRTRLFRPIRRDEFGKEDGNSVEAATNKPKMTLFGAAGYAKGRVANKEPTREAGAVISGAGYDAIIRDCKVYALPLIKLGQQPEAWTFISLQDIEWTERLIIAICRLLSPYCTGWVWPYNNRRLLCLGGGQWEAAVFKDELDRLVKPETRFAVKTYASTKMGDQPMRIVKSLLTPNQPYK